MFFEIQELSSAKMCTHSPHPVHRAVRVEIQAWPKETSPSLPQRRSSHAYGPTCFAGWRKAVTIYIGRYKTPHREQGTQTAGYVPAASRTVGPARTVSNGGLLILPKHTQSLYPEHVFTIRNVDQFSISVEEICAYIPHLTPSPACGFSRPFPA